MNKRIHMLTEGKGIGMTEAQWNAIVLENAKNFSEEEQDKKNKIIAQRAEMKAELQRQMDMKRQQEQNLKNKDREVHQVN